MKSKYNTITSVLSDKKYKSIVRQEIQSFHNSYNAAFSRRDNFIKWSYETQNKSFNRIAEEITNVGLDTITGEGVRVAYHKLLANEGGRS